MLRVLRASRSSSTVHPPEASARSVERKGKNEKKEERDRESADKSRSLLPLGIKKVVYIQSFFWKNLVTYRFATWCIFIIYNYKVI